MGLKAPMMYEMPPPPAVDPEVAVKEAASEAKLAAEKKAQSLGLDISEDKKGTIESKDNQIILSGTAYYDFNHFAEYWKKWKTIVKSRGDKNKLKEQEIGGPLNEEEKMRPD